MGVDDTTEKRKFRKRQGTDKISYPQISEPIKYVNDICSNNTVFGWRERGGGRNMV